MHLMLALGTEKARFMRGGGGLCRSATLYQEMLPQETLRDGNQSPTVGGLGAKAPMANSGRVNIISEVQTQCAGLLHRGALFFALRHAEQDSTARNAGGGEEEEPASPEAAFARDVFPRRVRPHRPRLYLGHVQPPQGKDGACFEELARALLQREHHRRLAHAVVR